jgi:hypothetical protein
MHIETDKKAEPKLILRGVQRRTGTDNYETTVLLFEGKGDYLQGYVVVNGQKRDVIAHINDCKADSEVSKVKSGFLKLSQREGNGNNISWHEVGYGHAMDNRKDGKQVFFDTVLFNVDGETLNARITKHVTSEMHAKLGFTSLRIERPKTEKLDKTEQAEKLTLKKPAAYKPSRPIARKTA